MVVTKIEVNGKKHNVLMSDIFETNDDFRASILVENNGDNLDGKGIVTIEPLSVLLDELSINVTISEEAENNGWSVCFISI